MKLVDTKVRMAFGKALNDHARKMMNTCESASSLPVEPPRRQVAGHKQSAMVSGQTRKGNHVQRAGETSCARL